MSKKVMISMGIIFMILSLIIFGTRGTAIVSNNVFGSTMKSKFVLHLYWSLYTGLIGAFLIVLGIAKD